MKTKIRLVAAIALVAVVGVSSFIPSASAAELPPLAKRLSAFYDHLDVEDRWIAGVHVDWETGVPDGRPETSSGRHTHCSAFVAAAAGRLGIYILRPPDHGQVLLANAQSEWLDGVGRGEGWRPVSDAVAAQTAANEGLFVVASYHNHRDDRPGHIAIVRPSRKTAELVTEEGPDIIQAGATNFTTASLRRGFAGHPQAWSDNEIAYYVHEVGAVP